MCANCGATRSLCRANHRATHTGLPRDTQQPKAASRTPQRFDTQGESQARTVSRCVILPPDRIRFARVVARTANRVARPLPNNSAWQAAHTTQCLNTTLGIDPAPHHDTTHKHHKTSSVALRGIASGQTGGRPHTTRTASRSGQSHNRGTHITMGTNRSGS